MAAEGAALLEVQGIEQYYGGSHILRKVSLEARVGEVTVVLGRNGVGKTTLLKSLMGVVPVRSGRVLFDGDDVTRETPYERARRGIGFVPQGREIFSRLTVGENLAMGLAYRPGSTKLPPELFELFPVLGQMLQRRGGDLSGGQQQQLAIARALAAGPRVLLLDEPSLGLAPKLVDTLFEALVQIRDRGVGVLLVEQRAQRTVALAARTHVLSNGAVSLTLAPSDAGDTDRLIAAYLA